MPSPATVADLVAFQAALQLDRAVIVQASPQGTDNSCLIDALTELRRHGREARGVAVVGESVDDSATACAAPRGRPRPAREPAVV